MTIMAKRLDETERLQLIGHLVRAGIIDQGMSFSEASRIWPISLPTLNKIMRGGLVMDRFYALAEINLGMPRGLINAIRDGETTLIRELAAGMGQPMKDAVLRGMGLEAAPRQERRSS